MDRSQAEQEWADALRQGRPDAWARYGREIEPRLTWLPGHRPGPQAEALRVFLRTPRADRPAPLAEFGGRAPLATWVQAWNVRLQREGSPAAPVDPRLLRKAVRSALQALPADEREALADRYRGALSDAPRAGRALQRMLGSIHAQLGETLTPREREGRLHGLADSAADAVCRPLREADAAEPRGIFPPPDAAESFRHLDPETLAAEASGQPVSLEAAAHLAHCRSCREDLEWVRRTGPARESPHNPTLAVLGAMALGLAFWLGGATVLVRVLASLAPVHDWSELRATAASMDVRLEPLEAWLAEARAPWPRAGGALRPVFPFGRIGSRPSALHLPSVSAGVAVRVRLHGPRASREYRGHGPRIPVAELEECVPRGAEGLFEVVEPRELRGRWWRFQVVAAEEQAAFLESLSRLLRRAPPSSREALRLALELQEDRDADAWRRARELWAEDGDALAYEGRVLAACAARRAGDRALYDQLARGLDPPR